MYGRIFESIYDGSLYGQWEALVTMQQLLILANQDGVVDMTPPAISGKTSIPLDVLEKGLTILAAPDPYSRSPDHDGVRIIPLEEHRPWGWFIVNYEKYKGLIKLEDKRVADRERIKKQRKSLNDKDVAKCSIVSQKVAHVDVDETVDETVKKRRTAPAVPSEFEEFKKIYPGRAGGNPWKQALQAINARLKDGCTWDEILSGTKRYRAYCEAEDLIGTRYVKQARAFCGPDEEFKSPWDLPRQPKSKNPDDHRHQELR